MRRFKDFMLNEHLPMLQQGKPHPSRKNLEQHPLFQKSTFGLEIEFKAMSAPLDNLPDKEDSQAEVPEELSYYDSEDQWANPDMVAPFYRIIVGYWTEKAIEVVNKSGFRAFEDKQSGETTFSVSNDGFDSDSDPVIEIRTCPLNNDSKTIEKIRNFLINLQSFLKTNKQFIMPTGNTGIHIHVSNPKILDQNHEPDPFTRLASICNTDEPQIWSDMAIHDRDFEHWARLNKMQDYSGEEGVHQHIIDLMRPYDRKPKTEIISIKQLRSIVSNIDRNSGINVRSEQPTVEYRYLSSAMLLQHDGPDKVIDYINYFMQHAAAQTNKNRITINGNGERIVLTRVPNGVRMDYQTIQRDYDDRDTEKYASVPQSGLPNNDLIKQLGKNERPADVSAKQFYTDKASLAARIKQLKGKNEI